MINQTVMLVQWIIVCFSSVVVSGLITPALPGAPLPGAALPGAPLPGATLPGAPIPCEDECPSITYQHYEALGCKPVYDDTVSDCCPASFDCGMVKLDPTKCYYNGEAYGDGQDMPVKNPCEKGCRCRVFEGSKPMAQCAQVECPSLFNPGLLQCDEVNSIDRCCPELTNCPVGVIRGADEEPQTTPASPPLTCEVEGKTYKDGQEIFPDSSPCRICICNKNFQDLFTGDCRTIECGMDYRDRAELDRGCTPIYYEGRCCNFEWMCPDDERIQATPEQTAVESVVASTHCSLGSISAPVGDTLATTADDMRCFCATPPQFTCIQYPTPENAQAAELANKRNV